MRRPRGGGDNNSLFVNRLVHNQVIMGWRPALVPCRGVENGGGYLMRELLAGDFLNRQRHLEG